MCPTISFYGTICVKKFKFNKMNTIYNLFNEVC